MADLLIEYLAADRLGAVLAVLVVAAIFASVKRYERIKPVKKADG